MLEGLGEKNVRKYKWTTVSSTGIRAFSWFFIPGKIFWSHGIREKCHHNAWCTYDVFLLFFSGKTVFGPYNRRYSLLSWKASISMKKEPHLWEFHFSWMKKHCHEKGRKDGREFMESTTLSRKRSYIETVAFFPSCVYKRDTSHIVPRSTLQKSTWRDNFVHKAKLVINKRCCAV